MLRIAVETVMLRVGALYYGDLMAYDVLDLKNGVLRLDSSTSIFGSRLEDFDVTMAVAIEKLMGERGVGTLVFVDAREHEYGPEQTGMLIEIADAIREIVRERRITSPETLGEECNRLFPDWSHWVSTTVEFQMRGDPIGAYVNLIRQIRHINIQMGRASGVEKECMQKFLDKVLSPIRNVLEKTKLIQAVKSKLGGHHIGDRNLYRKLFHPFVRPNFMFTKYVTAPPPGEIVDSYSLGDARVEVYRVPGKVRPIYHIMPPEFVLSEDEYMLLNDAKKVLESRRPKELEITDQTRMREMFFRIGVELIRDVAEVRGMELTSEDVDKLSRILTRYTAGLGVIELLLGDSKLQDISINSPLGSAPLFVVHSDFEECETNLIPTTTDGDRWSTRFKLISGRPLDEANPVLDTELVLPDGVARVAAIAPRLTPDGLAFSLRRHRFKPWTFPLFINNGFINHGFAGLMWFMAAYGRTILIAGTRSAGKTSLLGSLMLQIVPFYRMISVEDTFELPMEYLRKLGYNVERLKSRSIITKSELELSAEDAIRTALRMGDSCLFIGEVRSTEAKALYEAMRIGALANVVAGTIHGESAYGVFDRVVNDLGVPPTSFKATDLVVVCNKLKPPGGLTSVRKVVGVTEVRKHWQKDPVDEHGFVNLLEYSSKKNELVPSDTFLNGESYVLNDIARKVPGWYGRWDLIWENIQARGNVLKSISDIANSTGKRDLMESETVVRSNQMFDSLSDKSRQENGMVDSNWVYDKWLDWFKGIAKA